MKQLIIPIAIIVALIVLFVFVDRRDYNQLNGVQTIQSDNPTTNREQSVPVPQTKSGTEAKPAGKPSEPRLLAGMKPEENTKPVAIPVVTAEEAAKKNEEAIEYEKFWKRKTDKTILEGKVLSISECPDPKSIDYPDCNLSITISVNDINHTSIILVAPCIRDSKIVLSPTIKENSLVAFRLIDENDVTEDEKSIQLSDDNPDYDMDYCYVDFIEPVSAYSKISVYDSTETEKIIYDSTIPLTDQDKIVRDRYFKEETKRLNAIIENYSPDDAKVFYDSFLDLTKDIGEHNHPYAEIQYDDGSKKIFPVEVNVSPKSCLDAAFSNNLSLMTQNAEIISSIDKFFKERGILLIVVPFPQHFEAFADRFDLSRKLSTYNINRVRFMSLLLEKDVEVLDIEPMIEDTIESPFDCFLLLKKNLHPTEMGAYLCAKCIDDHLAAYDFYSSLKRNDYTMEIKKVLSKTIYYEEEFKGMETLSVNGDSPIKKDSPFLLVGDSFSMFSHIQNYLAYFFKTKINVINETSSFPNTTRLLQHRSQEISPNTKVCILLNTSYDLCKDFLPFIESNLVLFPNETFFPNQTLSLQKDNLQTPIKLEFDLDISQFALDDNKYRLVFYLTANSRQAYELKIDSMPAQKIVMLQTGQGVIEYPLSDIRKPLHITLELVSDDANPPRKEEKQLLKIDKIVLVER